MSEDFDLPNPSHDGDVSGTARRALEVAVRTQASLEMHVKNCDNRAGELKDAIEHRFDSFRDEVAGIKTIIVRAGWGLTGILLAVIASLVTFILQLLHNGARF